MRFDPASRGALDFRNLARELVEQEAEIRVSALDHWLQLLHGPEVRADTVTFVADFPHAQSVRVTGSFCGWSAEGIPLVRRPDGCWVCEIDLQPGEHQYRFVVDGNWRADPHNSCCVTNEFGEANSLVLVP